LPRGSPRSRPGSYLTGFQGSGTLRPSLLLPRMGAVDEDEVDQAASRST
jgi:hypothetical protein